MKMHRIVLLSGMLLASAGIAAAAVFVKDPVPIGGTGGYATGSLVTQNSTHSAITGFNGAWISGNTSVLQVDASGLAYPNNVNLTSDGGSFIVYNDTVDAQTTGRALSRSISTSGLPSSGDLYFSALLNVEAAAMAQLQNEYAYYIGVNRVGYVVESAHNTLARTFPPSGVYVGFYKTAGVVTVSLSVNGVKHTLIPSAVAGDTYFCVVKVELNAGVGGNEIVSAVANPVAASMDYGAGVALTEAAVLNTGDTFTYLTVGGYYPTNKGRVFFDEFIMADSNYDVCPIVSDGAVLASMAASGIDCYSATANGHVIVGGATVEIFIDVAPAGEEFSGSGSSLGYFAATAPLSAPLSSLMPDSEYSYRFRAEWMTGAATSSAAAFTTLGAVSFPSLSASNVGSTVSVNASVSHFGVAPTTVTLLFGESAGALSPEGQPWNNVAASASLSRDVADCEIGRLYYYAFKAEYEYNNESYEYTSDVKAVYIFSADTKIKTLYWGGGTTDIADGTPIPLTAAGQVGTWDKTTKNWSIDAAGSKYVAWTDGVDMTAHFVSFPVSGTATITLEDDVTLNKIIAAHDNNSAGGHNHNYYFTAAATRTITLDGIKPEMLIATSNGNQPTRKIQLGANAKLAAPKGFDKTGVGFLQVQSDSDGVKGLITAGAGTEKKGFELSGSSGALRGVDEFLLNNDTSLKIVLTSGQNDRINDNAVVRLSGKGAFYPTGAATAPVGSETFRQLVLDACGALYLNEASGDIHITEGISRGKDGTGTLSLEGATYGAPFPASVIIGGASVPTDVMLPWVYVTTAQPAQLNSVSKKFEVLSSTPAPMDLATWAAGTRYRISGAFTPINTIVADNIESLGVVNNNGAITLNIAAANTLDITSGQLVYSQSGSGTATRTIDGGRITSSSGQLYVMTGVGGSAMKLAIGSELTGDIDLIKSGALEVILSGAVTNTYTGDTYINGGRLTLNGNNRLAIPSEKVVINRTGDLYFGGSVGNKINTNANIIIREGGRLWHEDSSYQTYNGVMEIENGTLRFGGNGSGITFVNADVGIVFKNGGTISQTSGNYAMPFKVLTDVRYDAASSNQAFFTTSRSVKPSDDRVLQYLSLSTTASPAQSTRTFNINDSVDLPPETPEMVINMQLETEDGRDVDFVKTGSGALAFERVSGRFRGTVSVNDGALLLNGLYATQTVMTARTNTSDKRNLYDVDSNELRTTQPLGAPYVGRWISRITGDSSIGLFASAWNTVATNEITFLACGAFGIAPVTVTGSGILGGAGGSGGSVYLEDGGSLDAGTPANPVGFFQIGGDLDFSADGNWIVDIADADTCDVVAVAGDITLGGTFQPKLADGLKHQIGEWIIATYEGSATGRMSSPEGYSVFVKKSDKTIRAKKSNYSTMLIIR